MGEEQSGDRCTTLTPKGFVQMSCDQESYNYSRRTLGASIDFRGVVDTEDGGVSVSCSHRDSGNSPDTFLLLWSPGVWVIRFPSPRTPDSECHDGGKTPVCPSTPKCVDGAEDTLHLGDS